MGLLTKMMLPLIILILAATGIGAIMNAPKASGAAGEANNDRTDAGRRQNEDYQRQHPFSSANP